MTHLQMKISLTEPREQGVEPSRKCPTLVNNMLSAASSFRGFGPAVRAYNDSVDAVSEAAHGRDTTSGSKHFFVRDVTAGAAQRVPSWANGNQIVYGPFKTTAAGDGPIHKGDTVYIWINKTR